MKKISWALIIMNFLLIIGANSLYNYSKNFYSEETWWIQVFAVKAIAVLVFLFLLQIAIKVGIFFIRKSKSFLSK